MKSLKSFKFYSFDVESDPKTNEFKMVCLGSILYKAEDCFYHEVKTFFSISEFIEELALIKPKVLFCYNIKFDNVFIIDYLIEHSIQFYVIESNQAQLGLTFKLNEFEIVIKDFFAFGRSSLHNLSESLGTQTKKYPKNIESDDEWDRFFQTCNMIELQKHCENDVKMLNECIWIFRKRIFELFRIDALSKKIFSLASLSMMLFRSNFVNNPIENSFLFTNEDEFGYHLHENEFNFIHETYSGGYADVFSNNVYHDVVVFDINSSYPFQTTKLKFPVGKAYYTNSAEVFEEMTKEIAGFCKARIVFEKDKPYIPIKVEGKFQRAYGVWVGNISSIEYYYLKEKSLEIDFLEGYYFLEYDKQESLKNFCQTLYKNKQTADSKSTREIYKILLNALTGKFGQNPYTEKILYSIMKITDFEGLSENSKIVYKKRENCVVKSTIEKLTLKPFMMVSWISLITALGRLQLLDMIEKTKAIACDTDSVFCERKNACIESSNELGGWKLEKDEQFTDFRALAPKMYCGKTIEGKKFIKCKGIPKKYRDDRLYNQIMGWNGIDEIIVKDIHRFLGFKQSLIDKNAKFTSSNIIKATYLDKKMTPKLKEPINLDELYAEKEMSEEEYREEAIKEIKRKQPKSKKYSNKKANSPKAYIELCKEFDYLMPEDIDKTLSVEENAEILRNSRKDELFLY